ncbi:MULTISPECIES: MFS transporter [Pseudomonas]|uniref:MFS transporter n=1 Tax=Pseudomonas TaxID=286 RepID=UPI00095378DC|nr:MULTISPECIES: MFS transporter [Pseudomonas]WLG65407.1 MFS transporter [Pseudomonas brassicacearum]SIS02371.1 Sugar phosphate permease [Pseudomonas sp. A214]
MSQCPENGAWRPASVTNAQVKYATLVAFLAWTFAVYDFILFGMLLPEIGKATGLDDAAQARLATWVAFGTVVVALAVGPLVDRFGRRAGMVITVGGAGICSALTAGAGSIGTLMLTLIRSLAGLGYAEQGVNGAYLSELYSASKDPRIAKRRGLIYSLVQGGWPIGALLAAGLTAVLLPHVGWQGCFIFAAIPSLIVAFMATRLRESPQFEALSKIKALKASGKNGEAQALAQSQQIEHEHSAGLASVLKGKARRATLVLGCAHLLNWFPVQIFSVLGTTVLMSVHHVSFGNSLIILLLSNLVAYLGYLTHGYFGDRFGRRNVIAVGWMLGGAAFWAMLNGPSETWMVIALYSIGQFFLIGPYSCLLFYVGESYDSSVRGTGASIVTGIGPVGAIIASAGSAMFLGAGDSWLQAAVWFGAVPCVLSGFMLFFAAPVKQHTEEFEVAQSGHGSV